MNRSVLWSSRFGLVRHNGFYCLSVLTKQADRSPTAADLTRLGPESRFVFVCARSNKSNVMHENHPDVDVESESS
jgi:hypothetical protein